MQYSYNKPWGLSFDYKDHFHLRKKYTYMYEVVLMLTVTVKITNADAFFLTPMSSIFVDWNAFKPCDIPYEN